MLQRVQEAERPYRLGLDMGANSIGWFVIWLNEQGEPVELGPGGVRIHADGRDPQSKTSNAVSRRAARGARRRRDRFLARQKKLMGLLVQHGLMPADPAERKALEALDPYALRARAIYERLEPYELGRAIFHLNQRRGFKSNRKTDKSSNEGGAIKTASLRLDEAMQEAGATTLGEFLHLRRQSAEAPHKVPNVRVRAQMAGNKAEYDFYPTRGHLKDEFDAIWEKQRGFYPALTDAAYREIAEETIFFQRPLKEPPVGKCSLDPARDNDDREGFRCPWAHPLAQRFRIYQEVNNLSLTLPDGTARKLYDDEKQKVALALLQSNTLSFAKMKGMLNLPSDARFSLESEKRKDLKGDETAAILAKKDLFGKSWRGLTLEQQIEIVEKLESEQDEWALIQWLTERCRLDAGAAERVANANLPDGHARYGLRAIGKILPALERGERLYDAAEAAYPGHNRQTGEISLNGRLPYYGEWLQDDVVGTGDPQDPPERRYGRFPNPTVHIGLNQLRRLVNALIRKYGKPAEITLEMNREFRLSPTSEAYRKAERERIDNQKANERRAETIRAHGQKVNAENLLRLRLWEELEKLGRVCPYSGDPIPLEMVFTEEVDIDHILPFSRTWDDSAANKVLCRTRANRDKGNRTPSERWGNTPEYEDILARSLSLPRNKQWRFRPDAMERFEKEGGFLARQLNETSWLAKCARQYLAAVTGTTDAINILPGRLTAMIRGKWGLNRGMLSSDNADGGKNRNDHRHHAIDAAIAGLTDRKLLHRIANAQDDEDRKILIPEPFDGLREQLKARLEAMVVYHKPDHGLGGKGATSGQLHEASAYGIVKHPEKEDGATLVYRKAFTSLTAKEVDAIRDRRLRDLVRDHIYEEKQAGIAHEAALLSFATRVGKGEISGLSALRHVRLTKKEKLAYAVPVKDRRGAPYKAYSAGDNAFVDLFEDENGLWRGEAVTVFAANQPDYRPLWMQASPRPKHIMRIFKGDMIAADYEGKRRIMVAHRLDASANRFKLAENNEAGRLDTRHNEPADPFRWWMASYSTLQKAGACKVRVDDLGTVWRVESPFNRD